MRGPTRQPQDPTHRKGEQSGLAARGAAQQEGPGLLERDVPAHLVQEQPQDLRGEAGLHSQRPPQSTGVAGTGRKASHPQVTASPTPWPSDAPASLHSHQPGDDPLTSHLPCPWGSGRRAAGHRGQGEWGDMNTGSEAPQEAFPEGRALCRPRPERVGPSRPWGYDCAKAAQSTGRTEDALRTPGGTWTVRREIWKEQPPPFPQDTGGLAPAWPNRAHGDLGPRPGEVPLNSAHSGRTER